MTLPMVTCPLCCRPGFSTSDALCSALVGVTTRKLCCPICNEIVLGLDKFTIHLFGHSLKKFGCQSFKEPVQLCTIPSTELCNNNTATHGLKSNNKSVMIEESSKTKQINNLVKYQSCVDDINFKAADKSDWKLNNNNNATLQIENSKNINSQDNPLIYFRTDNGQLFALTQENIGTSLKNVTINTQNYITNTNITTSTLQTNVIEKVQKRKYNQINSPCKDLSQIPDKGLEMSCDEPDTPTSEIESISSTQSLSVMNSSVDSNDKKSAVREFESCRDLLTKGDFSTSTDDLIEACVSKETLSEPLGLVNDGMVVDEETKKNEMKSKDNFVCDICYFVFPNKTILAMHKQLIHKKVEVEIENKRKLFTCNICPKSFKMRGSLMLHRRVAHSGGFGNSEQESLKQPPPKPACQICGKFFKKEIHLSQHMKAHDEKQWQCTICSKTFTTKYFLKKHRRLHTGEMPYRCNTCSKAFTFQQSYHKHLLYHSDDKPYCCAQCGRLFKELSTLHNHERIHSGEKPFTCETCGKAFRQRVSYLVHRRIHTGVMPYKCTACDKSFRYKVSERTHKCTAQPPGVVVRTQANLVERLQAAMIKASEKNEKGEENKISLNASKSASHSAGEGSSKDKNASSASTVRINENKNPDKSVKEKPQYYLLVKGPNDEAYYQPVLVPSQKPISIEAQGVEPSRHIGQSLKPLKPSDSSNLTIKSPSIETIEKSFNPDLFSKHIEIVLKPTESKSSGAKKSRLSQNSTKYSSQEKELKFLESPKEKQSTSSKSLMGLIVEPNPDVKPKPLQENIRGCQKKIKSAGCQQQKNSPASSSDSDRYSDYFENSGLEKNKVLEGGETSEKDFKIDTQSKNLNSPSVDVMMDSTDFFSLMLSPALSSPSDRFGKLTLSPNSNASTSWNICGFDKQSLLSDNLQTDIDMTHDPLFENISDDALKEFLFGTDNAK